MQGTFQVGCCFKFRSITQSLISLVKYNKYGIFKSYTHFALSNIFSLSCLHFVDGCSSFRCYTHHLRCNSHCIVGVEEFHSRNGMVYFADQ